jgi:hypothetical protein
MLLILIEILLSTADREHEQQHDSETRADF